MNEAELSIGRHVSKLAVQITERLELIAVQNPAAFCGACELSHDHVAALLRELDKLPLRSWDTMCLFDGFLLRWREQGPTAQVVAEIQQHRNAWIFNAAMLF